jgi:hypothetical protein
MLLLVFLIQLDTLITTPLADATVCVECALCESLILNDSSLDDDQSSRGMLTAGDIHLPLLMIASCVALMRTRRSRTRYVIRTQLLTRLLPLC